MVQKATHGPVSNLIALYEAKGAPPPAPPKAKAPQLGTAAPALRELDVERSHAKSVGTPDRARAPAPSAKGLQGSVIGLRMEELGGGKAESTPPGVKAKSAEPLLHVIDTPKAPQDVSFAALNRPYPEGTDNIKFGDHTLFGFRSRDNGKANGFTKFAEFKDRSSPHQDSSWKAHISIDPNQLGQAWDIIGPELMKAGVPHFKVTRPSAIAENANHIASTVPSALPQLLTDDERLTKGMQVTVYLPEGQEKATLKVLEGIEKKLKKAGISPGKIDGSDEALGKFTSVRNDGGPLAYEAHDKAKHQQAPFKHF